MSRTARGQRRRAALASAALAAGIAIGGSGCAALTLPAVGVAALSAGLSAGAGSAVKAGTEFTFGGTAARTYGAPLEDVRRVLVETLEALQVKVTDETASERGGVVIQGLAYRRTITASLEPITPAMTRLQIIVRTGWLRKDPATASVIIDHTLPRLEPASVRPR